MGNIIVLALYLVGVFITGVIVWRELSEDRDQMHLVDYVMFFILCLMSWVFVIMWEWDKCKYKLFIESKNKDK